MAMIETSRITNALFHRRPEDGYSFLDRILTVATAPCSYPGCNRMRHVGSCNVDAPAVVSRDEVPAAPASGARLSEGHHRHDRAA